MGGGIANAKAYLAARSGQIYVRDVAREYADAVVGPPEKVISLWQDDPTPSLDRVPSETSRFKVKCISDVASIAERPKTAFEAISEVGLVVAVDRSERSAAWPVDWLERARSERRHRDLENYRSLLDHPPR